MAEVPDDAGAADARRADPGWAVSRRDVITTLNLVGGTRRVQKRRAIAMGDGLLMLRSIFIGYVIFTAFATLVLAIVLHGDGDPTRVAWWSLGAAALGAAGFAWSSFSAPLKTDDAHLLFTSYMNRFFFRVSTASVALVATLWLANIAHSLVPLVVGLLFGALNFWRAAPTSGNLVADQRVLDERECPLSLVEALRFPDVDEAWGRR